MAHPGVKELQFIINAKGRRGVRLAAKTREF